MSVAVEVNGVAGWITLDRPQAMNALNRASIEAATGALAAWRDDARVRVVVLTGRGTAFCAGADLKEAAAACAPGERDFMDGIVDFFDTLRAFPKPVIAAVNGLALAGGLETVMACDLVLAARSARFGDAHSNFGVFPGGGGASVLPRKVPPNVAKYLLFTGDSLGAEEMKTHGLVNEVLPDDELAARAQALAEKLAAKSPLGLPRQERGGQPGGGKGPGDALRHELLELRDHQRSYDVQEGLRAFAEKRRPQFKGC